MVAKRLPYGDIPPRPSVCSSNEAGLVLPLELSTSLCNLLSAMLVPAVRLRATMRTVSQSQWFKSMCTSTVAQLPPPPDELLYEPGEGEGSAWATFPRRSITSAPALPPSAVLFVSGDEG